MVANCSEPSPRRIVATFDRELTRGEFDDALHETVLPHTGASPQFASLPGIWTVRPVQPRLHIELVPGLTSNQCETIMNALQGHPSVVQVHVRRQ